MNINTVRENLRNTIAGKELALQGYKNDAAEGFGHGVAMQATIHFLQINIDELKRILTDVELCLNHEAANSWANDVDRQGGSFTNEEINRGSEW